MSAILLTDTDILRLAAQVNVQRAAGLIPTGGLLVNKGTYFQLMVTGTSAVTYTIVMEASDKDFQAKANILSGLGAFSLGAPQYINGMWTQAFGDMAGSGGGGGGSLPDGTVVDQTIQWDGSAWQPGVIPADGTVYEVKDIIGAPLPYVDISAAKGYLAGILQLDATGQTTGGYWVLNGTTPVLQVTTDGTTSWGILGPTGTGGLASGTTSTTLQGPTVTGLAMNSTTLRMTGGGSTLVDLVTNSLQPNVDNTVSNGASGKRWSAVWAGTGTIQTSDANYKTAPQTIPDAVLDAVGDVDLVQFKMLDAIAAKGEATARWHSGVIAQQVVEAFQAHGVDATEYGVVCYDEWPAEDAVLDRDGNELVPARPAGSMWSVRYEELLVLEAARVRRALSRLS